MGSSFQSLKIIELASVLAGPSVGQFFAELGAEVIKVENSKTNGDVTRSWKLDTEPTETDISSYFSSVNWGKKSIGIDLTKEEGVSLVHQLIKKADIVLVSFKPGDAEKLGVDYATLSAHHPTLIYGHLTGYGIYSSKVGYDAVIQAETGFMFMNGEKEGPPVKMPVALIDVLAGHQLKEGLLVALYERLLTGNGCYVHVSLFDTAVASLVNQAAHFLVAHHIPQRIGSEHPSIAPYGSIFETADGDQLILAIGSDTQFTALCKIIKATDLINNPRYETNQERVRNKKELIALLRQYILMHTKEYLLAACEKEKVPAGQIRNLKELFSSTNIESIMLQNSNLKGIRSFIAQFHEKFKSGLLSDPPHLGEHTFSILNTMGFSKTDIEQFIKKNIVH